MKTPREILLGRHRAVEPKLDRMRREILAETVAAVCDRRSAEREFGISAHRAPLQGTLLHAIAGKLWRELIIPLRWHFAAMSAVWLVVALLTVDHASAPSPVVAERNPASSRQILIALQENRRLLLEMIEPPAVKPPSAPLPRSERQLRNAVV